jgi:hypothetical protein
MHNPLSAWTKISFLPLNVASTAVALLALILSGLPSGADDINPNLQNHAQSRTCDPKDPLHIKTEPMVRNMMDTLGLNAAEIEFLQCPGSPFFTSGSLDSSHNLVFRITYPDGLEKSQYLAPITHELGHVYQLSHAGSLAALRKQMHDSMLRIELGADFLAGVAFKRNLPASDLILLEQNLMLTGDFTGTNYGSPAQRTSAFRMGYFSRIGEKSVDDASGNFQTDGFAQIEAQNP